MALIKGSCGFYAIDGYSSFYAFEVDGGVEACASNSSNPAYPECAGSVQAACRQRLNGF
jgi:beta-glucosidase